MSSFSIPTKQTPFRNIMEKKVRPLSVFIKLMQGLNKKLIFMLIAISERAHLCTKFLESFMGISHMGQKLLFEGQLPMEK